LLCSTSSVIASVDDIQLPPGFSIEEYADVPKARSLALGDRGTLFVSNRKGRSVYAVVEVLDIDLPSNRSHGWRYIGFGPDGKLYISIGAPCNVCDELGYAQIIRVNPDGTERETFASGVRNSVGFTWHPETRDLWFTDNGRDMLGDDLPPCELNHAPRQGLHFGFPYCHGGDILDPKFGKDRDCANYTPPVQKLGPHVAPLGVKFYTGDMFPPEYRGQVFIAEHGSWNRSKKIGYRISLVRLDGDTAISYEPFAFGWLQGEQVSGRPVDLIVKQDGSLLVSDDQAGKIYRISYKMDDNQRFE
jgi:glucose/arabinose dehydrogenase